MNETSEQTNDKKEALVAEMTEKLGCFTVSVLCAQMDSLSSAQAAYNRFIEMAAGAPSRTTTILGEILENRIDPRKGPVVGVLSHDKSCRAQEESFQWFASFAERFHGLSSTTMWCTRDKNGSELMILPLRVYDFKHLY